MITFTIPIEPVAKGRPRFSTRGRFPIAYTPAKTRSFERDVALYAKSAIKGQKPLEGPLSVEIGIYRIKAKSCKHVWPIIKPDLDNYEKAICDALNGICWVDDAQIIEKHSFKAFNGMARITISIEEVK